MSKAHPTYKSVLLILSAAHATLFCGFPLQNSGYNNMLSIAFTYLMVVADLMELALEIIAIVIEVSVRRYKSLGFILLIGLLLRVSLAVTTVGNFDMRSYELVARITSSGQNVYAETNRYNYSPVWFTLLHAADEAGTASGIPLRVVVRVGLSVVDILNAVLIGLIAERLAAGTGYVSTSVYALNPGAILISGFHGQFETLAMLPILAGVLLLARQAWEPDARVALMFMLGIVIKHNTVFVVWPILAIVCGYYYSVGVVVAGVGIMILTLLPFWPDGHDGIIRNVFLYSGVDNNFALAAFLPRSMSLVAMVASVAVVPILFPKRALRGTLVALLLWHLTGTFGVQYFTYIFLIAPLVVPHRRYILFLALMVSLCEISYMLPVTDASAWLIREPIKITIFLILFLWLLSLLREQFGANLHPLSWASSRLRTR